MKLSLTEHPHLLCPTHIRVWPKLPFGSHISDFVFQEANLDYLLVEIERSTHRLFDAAGHPLKPLTVAIDQIVDWKRYISYNVRTVEAEQKLAGITPDPNGLVVIGRSSQLSDGERPKLKAIAQSHAKLRIMTYDDIHANAKAVFENILGPFWEMPEPTQVYYPAIAH